ncbi:L-arabinose transporter ATP-binding protein [Paenibacillus sp. 32O-W]|uniref:ATP-binding cassette domain-containing protein n=1 Tax=Paenibacillus sp. 32O-W TaxID=1695218 RepID=UPI00071F37B8|nr:ATP-binding cassette domain-containing protein [Paenibacillus sp. 32O-W]ALS25599.1 L-arabinose transporter ATP-binding protein [Paenibacillus sp. 32O-W]
MKTEILRFERVTTKKDDVTLLNNFSLHLFQGEITGLVCLNTFGRDSLLALIRQNLPIHYGRIYFNGELVNHYQHSTLTLNKVAVIDRKCILIEHLTVVDNIFVLRRGLRKFFINKRLLKKQLHRFTKEIGVRIAGDRLVADLTPYEKCLVELLRAIISGAKLIVVKDISNAISAAELSQLHELLRWFCGRGLSFLYICNHHEEAFKICDRMCLMQDGRIIKKLDRKDFQHENMFPYYIGKYANITKAEPAVTGKMTMLSFRGVSTQNLDSLTFHIAKGECTVLLDSDNTMLADFLGLMSGEISPRSGSIWLGEERYAPKQMHQAVAQGVAFIQENPTETMLFKELSYVRNLCFLIDRNQHPVRLSKRVIKSVIREYEPIVGQEIHETHILNLKAESLYNLIYYSIHLYNPKLVICVQPFAGADMYLRVHIVELIQQLKRKGITVVILAMNIADSLMVADKLIQMQKGRLHAEYASREFGHFRSESTLIP